MTDILVAIDPGKATGFAIIDVTNPDFPYVVSAEELPTEAFYGRIEEVFLAYQFDSLEVVIEDFKITKRTADLTDAPWSLNLIGVTQYFCWKYKRAFTLQLPARKPFASNERLRQVNFWHVGGEGHANDALRHAMIYIVDNNPSWARKLIVPDK